MNLPRGASDLCGGPARPSRGVAGLGLGLILVALTLASGVRFEHRPRPTRSGDRASTLTQGRDARRDALPTPTRPIATARPTPPGPVLAQILPIDAGPSRPRVIPVAAAPPPPVPVRPARGSTPSPPARLDEPPPPQPSARTTAPDPESSRVPRRIRVRTRAGRTVVARVHGEAEGRVTVMLPDGQLGLPDRQIYTDEPFRPATPEAMADDLLAGPFAGFETLRKPHYLILYQSTDGFARESGRVLEELHRSLADAFRKFAVPVREPEFPLVAVIFRTERDFRAHKAVDPEVQAYYELYSNRIYFYQTSDRDLAAPEVAALRRPQTVAHEGTHQILQNIGIQPRLADWPAWLIEGLAEYCSTPVTGDRGANWAGLGVLNPIHLATIRDLDDPLSGQVAGATRPGHIGRTPGMPLVEYLVTRAELTPTDYALAWGLTYYLARRRADEFVAYLKSMSRLPPLETRTPADHLAAFRKAFGRDLARLDHEVGGYLSKLKVAQHLPYYAVVFEQRDAVGQPRRAAIVSQSPSMIRQWLETVTSPRDDPPYWEAVPYDRRTPALLAAETWVHDR